MAEARIDKKAMALERLRRSRAALRGLSEGSTPSGSPATGDHPANSQSQLLASLPGLSHVLDLATAMWAKSPLWLPAQVAGMQWRGVVAPLIRRHPLASLVVAAAAGYAITRHRRALLGVAAGTLWSTLLPPAQAALHSLLGALTDPGQKAHDDEEPAR